MLRRSYKEMFLSLTRMSCTAARCEQKYTDWGKYISLENVLKTSSKEKDVRRIQDLFIKTKALFSLDTKSVSTGWIEDSFSLNRKSASTL